jgi:hypothetical protein
MVAGDESAHTPGHSGRAIVMVRAGCEAAAGVGGCRVQMRLSGPCHSGTP